MSRITIDSAKCAKCGVCAEVCVFEILEMKDRVSLPSPIDERASLCVKCGHCEVFCPTGALTLDYGTGARKVYETRPIPPASDVGNLMRMRRSIRNFRNKPVPKETIEELLDIVRFAPSGVNLQPLSWLVVYDRDEVKKIAGLVIDWMKQLVKENSPVAARYPLSDVINGWEAGKDVILRGAPHVVIVHAHNDQPVAPTDSIIALTYLELALPSFGLGGCWAGFLMNAMKMWEPLRNELALPGGHVPYGALMIGYSKHKSYRVPERNEAKITWM